MADTKDLPAARAARKASGASARATAADEAASAGADDAADAERRLARYAARGIPIAAIGGAIGTGLLVGLGPAILVLAAGTLLSTIALLWASLRTLSGDAPLPTDLENIAVRSRKVDNLGEQKRRVLRALKDLELEHSVGKIDDKDFASLGDRFRADAKALMREMDGQIDPLREEAERLVQKHLEKRGLGDGAPLRKKPPDVKHHDEADDDAEKDVDDDSEKDIDEAVATDEGDAVEAEETEEAEEAEPPKAVVPPAKPSKPGKSKPAVKPAAKPAAEVVASLRLACPKCDVSNEPDAAFCKKCGTALTAEESHA